MSVTLNRHDRRGFLRLVRLAAAGTAVTLASGCAWFQQQEANLGTTAGSAAVQQFFDDVQAFLTTVKNTLATGAKYFSATTLSALQGDLADAENGLSKLQTSASTVISSSTAKTLYNLLYSLVTAALAALANVSGASSILGILQTAYDVLPGVWTFVSGLLPSSTTAATAPMTPPRTAAMAPASAPPHKYSVVTARQMLGIPTVAAR